MKMSATPLFDPTDASSVSHEPRAHRADVTVPAADAAPPAAATLVTELPQTLVTGSYTPGSGVLAILGDGAANTLTVSRDAAGQLLVNGGAIAVAGGTPTVANTARIQVFGLAGNDVIALDESNGALPAADLFGGNGNDTLTGGSGADLLFGQAGNDTLQFNGANIAETINIAANGGRVLFTRNIASVTMDLDDVETLRYNALGGADAIGVHDLSATDVTAVQIDLAGTVGGSAPDGAADTVTIDGTDGDDVIQLSLVNGALVVDGLAARVVIDHFDPALDTVRILGLGGDDVIDASALPAGMGPRIEFDGGSGDDVLLGSPGGSTLLGGDGDDVLIGGPGNDWIDGGTGADILIGGGGTDVILDSLVQTTQPVHTGLFAA